ncbi:MAG: hypothetical protein HFF43_08505 [Lawsonibacter sp.]|jgi:hypothetical protein|nr:hypothetical protein [Lawsonibacter sp.]
MIYKRAAAVLGSVLFCPAVFLLLWTARIDGGAFLLLFGYPLVTAAYFIAAGGVFQKKLGLRRGALCLWMALMGYALCWVFLLFWQPDLLQDWGIVFSVFLLLGAVQVPVWLAVWLGLWVVSLVRSPEARDRAKKRGKMLLNGLFCLAVFTPIMLIALSVKTWLAIKPPEAYADQGVYAFTAVDYELIWEKRTRHHHTTGSNRITTYYVPFYWVTYETADGRWQWQDNKPTQDIGKQAVREGETVERRVLALVDEEGYITIDGAKTVQGYVDGQKLSCGVLIGGSLAVLALEGGVYVLWRRNKRL